jgi:glycosyltransferase involved in cell wall biosynthesis
VLRKPVDASSCAPGRPRIAALPAGNPSRGYSGRLVTGSLLIVTHFYPPSSMVAARRPAGLAKYLRRLGYRVTVLTSRAWAEGPAGEPDVVRTGDLMASRLNWRRANMQAWTQGGAEYEAGSSKLAQVVVPDTALVTWLPYLVPSALRLARRERFDCAITTSGPESVHLAGVALARRTAWVADLRDGWGFETLHSWPTSLQTRLDAALERQVARRADLMTAVSEPMAADLRERLGADAHTVTNGFDPEEVPARTGSHPLLHPERRSLVHTGRMASSQRSPAPLLEALRLLRTRGAAAVRGLELVFAGPLTTDERALLESPDLSGLVRHVGSLDRDDALRLQREADGLLLLTAGSRRGEATGKLYEYLGAERPILVLGDRSEAARIVEEAGAGVTAPADQPEAIAAALERLPRGLAAGAPARYSYPELARRYAELVERARSRAAERSATR